MQTLDLRRDTSLDAATRHTFDRLVADLGRRWPELPAPIVLPWSEHQAVALDRGKPWIYGPAHSDPLMGTGDRAVLPRRQRRQLARLAATGARFDAIGVAHELDPKGAAKTLLPLLADGPRTCSEVVARELVGPAPAHPGVVATVGMLGSLVRGDTARRAATVLDRLLDPVVFGVVAPWPLSHGAPSVWQPLVAWRW